MLLSAEWLDFKFLQKETESTAGNLSIQIRKLEEAGYISIEKRFKDNYPQTRCKLTEKGREAFAEYVSNLQEYLR
jgi:DNA-binding MarR family transcriptional regulator